MAPITWGRDNIRNKHYLFRFFHKMDIERVEKGSPWTFNNHLLILHQIKEDEDPLVIPHVYVDFWVQIHDLSPGFFRKKWQKCLVILFVRLWNMI